MGRGHFPVGKEHLFRQSVTHPHDDPSVDLAIVQKRIENFTCIVGRIELRELDLTAFGIYRNFGHLGANRSLRPDLGIFVMALHDDR